MTSFLSLVSFTVHWQIPNTMFFGFIRYTTFVFGKV
jgi:hypothetical protein